MEHRYRARAFGLVWASDTPLDLFAPADEDGVPDVLVSRRDTLPARGGGLAINNGFVFADGIRLRSSGALFDMWDGTRVDWTARPDATLPVTLFSTISALLLAWRGATPLHGSAVRVGDRATVICGPSGAGKSSLAWALTALGGELVSDDLTVIAPGERGAAPMLWPGRPAVRLLPGTGAVGPDDGRGKMLIRPPMVALERAVPLAGVVLLREGPPPANASERFAALHEQLFRPRWMQAMPHRQARLATLAAAAGHVTVETLPPAPLAAEPVGMRAARLFERLDRSG